MYQRQVVSERSSCLCKKKINKNDAVASAQSIIQIHHPGLLLRLFSNPCSPRKENFRLLSLSLPPSHTRAHSHTLALSTKNYSPETSPEMSSPAPAVSAVPGNSTAPPPPDTTTTTVSQVPPPSNSSGSLVPPPPASLAESSGRSTPSTPVLSALIVGVILGVLAGVGISVYVYRRKKRKEAQRLLLAGQPSQGASKGFAFFYFELRRI